MPKKENDVLDKFTHELRPDIYHMGGLTIRECLHSVEIDGVVYYDDIPRLITCLSKIIDNNSDICFGRQ